LTKASKSGTIETKGGNVKHKKDLWVVVKDNTLYMYKEENQVSVNNCAFLIFLKTSDPVDWFSLSSVEVRIVEKTSSRDFCFALSSSKKLFKEHKFYPKTEQEMQSWIQVISHAPQVKAAHKAGFFLI
jgi:hypothetical protein